MIEEIPEFTFGHCTSLREVFLLTTLLSIRVKAFMSCAALVELAIPPALKYIGVTDHSGPPLCRGVSA